MPLMTVAQIALARQRAKPRTAPAWWVSSSRPTPVAEASLSRVPPHMRQQASTAPVNPSDSTTRSLESDNAALPLVQQVADSRFTCFAQQRQFSPTHFDYLKRGSSAPSSAKTGETVDVSLSETTWNTHSELLPSTDHSTLTYPPNGNFRRPYRPTTTVPATRKYKDLTFVKELLQATSPPIETTQSSPATESQEPSSSASSSWNDLDVCTSSAGKTTSSKVNKATHSLRNTTKPTRFRPASSSIHSSSSSAWTGLDRCNSKEYEPTPPATSTASLSFRNPTKPTRFRPASSSTLGSSAYSEHDTTQSASSDASLPFKNPTKPTRFRPASSSSSGFSASSEYDEPTQPKFSKAVLSFKDHGEQIRSAPPSSMPNPRKDPSEHGDSACSETSGYSTSEFSYTLATLSNQTPPRNPRITWKDREEAAPPCPSVNQDAMAWAWEQVRNVENEVKHDSARAPVQLRALPQPQPQPQPIVPARPPQPLSLLELHGDESKWDWAAQIAHSVNVHGLDVMLNLFWVRSDGHTPAAAEAKVLLVTALRINWRREHKLSGETAEQHLEIQQMRQHPAVCNPFSIDYSPAECVVGQQVLPPCRYDEPDPEREPKAPEAPPKVDYGTPTKFKHYMSFQPSVHLLQRLVCKTIYKRAAFAAAEYADKRQLQAFQARWKADEAARTAKYFADRDAAAAKWKADRDAADKLTAPAFKAVIARRPVVECAFHAAPAVNLATKPAFAPDAPPINLATKPAYQPPVVAAPAVKPTASAAVVPDITAHRPTGVPTRCTRFTRVVTTQRVVDPEEPSRVCLNRGNLDKFDFELGSNSPSILDGNSDDSNSTQDWAWFERDRASRVRTPQPAPL